MIRKSLGMMTGMVLTASVGAVGAAELGNKAQVPQILASLDRSGYEQLSAQKMAETVGTQVPTEFTTGILGTLLSAGFSITSGATPNTSIIDTDDDAFWPVTITETTPGTNWTATSDDGLTLNITRSGSNLVISTPGSTQTLTLGTGGTPSATGPSTAVTPTTPPATPTTTSATATPVGRVLR